MSDLKRFIDAQKNSYPAALAEIKEAKKTGHWMWYVFPQIQGLGSSSTSKFYAIKDIAEASEFLHHPVLGKRLVEICTELLKLETTDAYQIFGSPDDLKLKSSMTLFASVANTNPIFRSVLDKFFNGIKDSNTLKIIAGQPR
jgi:uncharacterized protein (DUF1810 family)